MADSTDYSQMDYSRWTRRQAAFRNAILLIIRLFTRIQVEGQENIPTDGPFVLAPNHIHMFDIPVIFGYLPRRTVVFAADKWQKIPVFGWLLSFFGDAIYVHRGEPDRKALKLAVDVLQAGGVLGLAPEGTRSRTGGLQQGRTGVVYLANRGGAPILPVVAFGQEKAFSCWLRLRKVPICVRIGKPIHLPPGKYRTPDLDAHTDALMMTLARMLPAEYRGVYARRFAAEEE
ncbi:MAG: 1-acyl-sn-glycerol-3-phosphate acyltransferase [Caldilineaceae bacterium]|nr:1-acyl-sn-glycerol-3-phosphate acyltransferase [Caldilineaceae bacterium]